MDAILERMYAGHRAFFMGNPEALSDTRTGFHWRGQTWPLYELKER